MKISPAEVETFYSAWLPILDWVNERRKIVPKLHLHPEPRIDPAHAIQIRDVLFADDSLLEEFVAKDPARLPESTLDLVRSWRYRRTGQFCVWKHYQKHTVFLDDKQGYAVLGLRSELEDILPMPPPLMVHAALLPFGDRIITDGLIASYSIRLGPGIRSRLKHQYQDAQERGAILSSLLPLTETSAQAQDAATREATNQAVLRSFHTHLRRLGLSDKIIDRDMQTARALERSLSDRSLRESTGQDAQRLISAADSLSGGRCIATGLKRFFTFLQHTERMDDRFTRDVLASLKSS